MGDRLVAWNGDVPPNRRRGLDSQTNQSSKAGETITE